MGEEVKAVVQPHDMAKAGKELEARTDRVLPQASVADQMPQEHRLRSRTARTPTGKLVKAHLRDRYWRRRGAGVGQSQTQHVRHAGLCGHPRLYNLSA